MIEYKVKIVTSGSYVEVYRYADSAFKNTKSRMKKKRTNDVECDENGKPIPKEKADHSQNNVRVRTSIRRLVNANPCLKKFITLTFKENVTDLNFANYEHEKYIKRLKRFVPEELKYLTVIEFQKRGAVHYHSLLNVPYIENKRLRELWGNGFVRINQIDHVENVGAYISKYIGKEPMKERGRKKFFHSRNLEFPKETIFPWFTFLLLHSKELTDPKNLVFTKKYQSRFYGEVTYEQYYLKQTETKNKDFITGNGSL